MADSIVNTAKGAFTAWARLPAANDAVIAVPLEASGLESHATLIDYDNLGALLAAANNEQTSNGTRKTLASVTVTVDDTNNRVDVDAADPVWTGLTGNALGAIVMCYDSDTTGGADTAIELISVHDFAVTPDGTDVTAQIASGGFARAS
jgi:hypothetical protein